MLSTFKFVVDFSHYTTDNFSAWDRIALALYTYLEWIDKIFEPTLLVCYNSHVSWHVTKDVVYSLFIPTTIITSKSVCVL